MFAALSKLKSVIDGPSMLFRIKQSNVVVLRRFLQALLICFMAENDCSHSAVITRITAVIMAILVRSGYNNCRDSSVTKCFTFPS